MVLDVHGKKEPSARDLFSLNVAKIFEKQKRLAFFHKALDPHFTALQKVKRTAFNFKNFGFIFWKPVYFF